MAKVTGTTGWTTPSNICGMCLAGGEACSANNDCPTQNDVCEFNGIRGTRNPTWPDRDYCGNKPRTFNISVNDDSSASITDGSWVALKFNTSADPEQLPLQNILINWSGYAGEEPRYQDQQTIYFPYAPKSSQESPHVVSHRYFCDINNQPTTACGAGTYPCWDQGSGSCVYQPRLIVEDNWGWCSSNPADGRCDKGASNFPASVNAAGLPIQVLVRPNQ